MGAVLGKRWSSHRARIAAELEGEEGVKMQALNTHTASLSACLALFEPAVHI